MNGVDLEITPGDTICIIGKSGCGKSVLLKHIVGLLEPNMGKVLVDGMEVAKMKADDIFELRKQIGYVFQSAALFDSMTVYENTIIGLYEHGERDHEMMEKEAIRVLSAVGLLPDRKEVSGEEFLEEWEILKNKKPADLSGGMRKRVGVARALVGSPKFVFYDEPTTGLDPVTSEQIDALIEELTKRMNVTSIVITHDMFSVFKIAKTVAMLDKGKVRFFGTVDELRKSDDKEVIEFLERYDN